MLVVIISKISSDIHKSRLCSAQYLYASEGLMAVGFPTNNQRGQSSGPCRLCGGLDKARQVVPTALLVRVQKS